MMSEAAATSSIGSTTAITTISTVEQRIAQCGVARRPWIVPSTGGRFASRAMANATRDEE